MAYGTALEKRPPVLRSAGSNPALSAIERCHRYQSPFLWRGAGVADQARLESVCIRKVTVGSNPTLSAIKLQCSLLHIAFASSFKN